jgi:hypothetical protein
MKKFYLEVELVKPVSDYFKKIGYIVRREIRIGFCRVDLLAIRGGKVVAIELKLNDWKTSLKQAKNYQLGADYVYVVFPLMRVYAVLRKSRIYFEKEGIGLLVVNERTNNIHKIINAKESLKKMGTLTFNQLTRLSN